MMRNLVLFNNCCFWHDSLTKSYNFCVDILLFLSFFVNPFSESLFVICLSSWKTLFLTHRMSMRGLRWRIREASSRLWHLHVSQLAFQLQVSGRKGLWKHRRYRLPHVLLSSCTKSNCPTFLRLTWLAKTSSSWWVSVYDRLSSKYCTKRLYFFFPFWVKKKGVLETKQERCISDGNKQKVRKWSLSTL